MRYDLNFGVEHFIKVIWSVRLVNIHDYALSRLFFALPPEPLPLSTTIFFGCVAACSTEVMRDKRKSKGAMNVISRESISGSEGIVRVRRPTIGGKRGPVGLRKIEIQTYMRSCPWGWRKYFIRRIGCT